MVVATRSCSECTEQGVRGSPVEHFAGSPIEFFADPGEVFAGVNAQVGALGEVVAEEAVGVSLEGRRHGLPRWQK